jgi:hypothetical protein
MALGWERLGVNEVRSTSEVLGTFPVQGVENLVKILGPKQMGGVYSYLGKNGDKMDDAMAGLGLVEFHPARLARHWRHMCLICTIFQWRKMSLK